MPFSAYWESNMEIARVVCAGLSRAGFRRVTAVRDSVRAFDLAFIDGNQRRLVVRCVARAVPEDYRALKTMLAQGTFDRAVLIYCDRRQPHLSDEIESWAIEDLGELAQSLADERAPA